MPDCAVMTLFTRSSLVPILTSGRESLTQSHVTETDCWRIDTDRVHAWALAKSDHKATRTWVEMPWRCRRLLSKLYRKNTLNRKYINGSYNHNLAVNPKLPNNNKYTKKTLNIHPVHKIISCPDPSEWRTKSGMTYPTSRGWGRWMVTAKKLAPTEYVPRPWPQGCKHLAKNYIKKNSKLAKVLGKLFRIKNTQ